MKRSTLIITVFSTLLLATACDTVVYEEPPKPKAENAPSSAIFAIPASLAGAQTNNTLGSFNRSVASDALVKSTVESYYSLVRDEIRYAKEVSESVKNLLTELESLIINDTLLLDRTQDIDYTNPDTHERFNWTVITPNASWHLEIWENWNGTSGNQKAEIAFSKDADGYSGTVILDGNVGTDRDEADPTVEPAMVRITFDANNGAGYATLKIELKDFRCIEDIEDASADDLQDAVLEFKKFLSTGEVSVASTIKVPNSRHFVWNGYIENTSGEEVLNLAANSETWYYCAYGSTSGGDTDKATMYMSIAPEIGPNLFTDYGLGDLIGNLFAARINNDYDFDGTQDTDSDEGHELIANLALVPGVTIDTTAPYENTAADYLGAFITLRDYFTTAGQTDEDLVFIDWLITIMGVENPAYFESSSYTGNGTAPSTGYPDITPDYLLVPSQAVVDGLTIAF